MEPAGAVSCVVDFITTPAKMVRAAWRLHQTGAGNSKHEPQTDSRRLPVIHVIAVITAKPGMRENILTQFRANVPAVLAEAGCIEYGAAVDAQDAPPFHTAWGPDTFVVVEKWESLEALKAHAAAPHMASYGARTKEFIAARVIHVMSPA